MGLWPSEPINYILLCHYRWHPSPMVLILLMNAVDGKRGPNFLGRIKIHLQGSGASLMGRVWRGSGVGGGRRREKWVGRGQGGYMGTPGASEWVGTIDLEMASQQGTSSPFK